MKSDTMLAIEIYKIGYLILSVNEMNIKAYTKRGISSRLSLQISNKLPIWSQAHSAQKLSVNFDCICGADNSNLKVANLIIQLQQAICATSTTIISILFSPNLIGFELAKFGWNRHQSRFKMAVDEGGEREMNHANRRIK